MSNVQNLKEEIIKKAWSDVEFKKQLLADPKSAVKDVFGIEVPDHIELVVTEETADKFYLAIPQNPAEVSDSQVAAPKWL